MIRGGGKIIVPGTFCVPETITLPLRQGYDSKSVRHKLMLPRRGGHACSAKDSASISAPMCQQSPPSHLWPDVDLITWNVLLLAWKQMLANC
jgi:hypothetical protein